MTCPQKFSKMDENKKENQDDLFEKYDLMQKLKGVQVPTRDLDVQIYLRKLNQPICLFGEGPKERKDRLRTLLINEVTDIAEEGQLAEMMPKYVNGPDVVGEAKKIFIDFSVQRAKERIERERAIDQERIDQNNINGLIFKDYETYFSCPADKRPLVSIASCGDAIIIGSLSGKASIWSFANKYEEPIFEYLNHTERITAVNFLNNAITITASADKTVRFWDEASEVALLSLSSIPKTVCGHPMGSHALIGASDGDLIVYDVSTQQIVSKMKAHDGSISALASHTDGGLVMTGGADFYGRLWDLRSMKMIKVMQGHSNRLTCATFDNDFHAVSGSADNSIIIWDLRNLSRSKRISAHNTVVSSVNVYGDLLISSSNDNIKVWSMLDFRTYKTISDCPSPITCTTITQNSFSSFPSIFSAFHDGSWRMYLDENCNLP
ncbi:hypothetical protein M9Y10_045003 [Tritrichomonas musculus]|uniref:Pre-mRNA processing factor 4 (PRP4)-like domain-containing protein n=1 Tax=Tritrichomonas musculus TaxID=1915356 RepID=A0ABR2JUD7_9EUKA